VCYSVVSRFSFEKVDVLISELKDRSSSPILLVATMCDLRDVLDRKVYDGPGSKLWEDELITTKEGIHKAKKWACAGYYGSTSTSVLCCSIK